MVRKRGGQEDGVGGREERCRMGAREVPPR
jgi:hypothetical protein